MWLRGPLELPSGVPSHDTSERVFDRPEPHAPRSCSRDWVRAVSAAVRIEHVAIDGKALRGSASAELGPLHLASAWATAQPLPEGRVAADAKSDEATATPAPLDLLGLNGALVTIDVAGCRKAVAEETVGQGGHRALAAKGN